MPKFIDEVLSEILGVHFEDITFSLCVESVGQTLGDYYVNGIQRSTIEFKTKIRIELDRIGSIYLYPVGGVLENKIQMEYFYKGILVKGEETSRIAKAVYEGLSWVDFV